jgi:predicted dehydrogenase
VTDRPLRVGLVGCGAISASYLATIAGELEVLELAACADLDRGRAEARAAEFGIARTLTVDELLADPAVDLVLNLTWPGVHAEVTLAALEAGKHVYGEKPLATEVADGRRILEVAAASGRRVGCAPDTFLGDGMQEVRRALDAGAIGVPLGGGAWSFYTHPATVHHAPQFLYAPGGGPLFDIAPYPIATFVSLLGPVAAVLGSSRVVSTEQTIGSGPDAGTSFPVTVPTWTTAILEHESGASTQLLTTWEVAGAAPWEVDDPPPLQLWGSEGVIWPPDPNGHDRTLRLLQAGEAAAGERAAHNRNTVAERDHRGLGLLDMALALREGRPHRCSAELALHVLETIAAIEASAASGRRVDVTSTCERPAPMPERLAPDPTDQTDARREYA